MSAPARRIAHLDMDAFYASVELLRYPQLAGQPVVIGGSRRNADGATTDPARSEFARLRDYVGRGVITTSTYAARALGVHSGMGIMKAARLAPEAILLPLDFDAYRHHSRQFKAAVRAIAPQVEDRGIDEIYIDLSALTTPSRELAQQLKDAVRGATGLSCSICVAPNKLLAKIGSDLDKPDGLTLLDHADLQHRIWPLAARKINGIGPKAAEKLEALGIRSIGELAAAEPQWLIGHFGRSYGAWLHEAANGRDQREVVTESEPKSISRETTFEHDLHPRHDRAALTTIFTDLCVRVADDLQRKGYAGRSIGIKLRYEDFRTVTRDHSLTFATQDARVIRRVAGECLKRVPLEQRLRLLGVKASNLVPAGEAQAQHPPETGDLFET